MAIGLQDVVIPPAAMHWLRQVIQGCPDPLELAEAGHFVQEHGEVVAQAAVHTSVRTTPERAEATTPVRPRPHGL